MSYRAARDLLRDEYMTELSDKIFPIKDATLLPKAGACTDCTKRTGNQPDIFDDVKSADVCTDTVCFAMKRTAQILAIQQKYEDEGCAVITGKDAKKIIQNPSWGSHASLKEESGYVDLSKPIPNDPNGRTWEQALGKQTLSGKPKDGKPAVQKTMIENTHTKELIPTVKMEDAIKALREMGIEVKLTGSASRQPSGPSKEDIKIDAEMKQANAFRRRLFDTLHARIETDMALPTPHVSDGLYRILAEYHFSQMIDFGDDDAAEHIAKSCMPNLPEEVDLMTAFQEHIPQMTTQQHFLLLMDMLMADEIKAGRHNRDKQPAMMSEIAKEIGIDTAKIEAEVAKELKPIPKKAASPAVKKEKTASTPTPAAQAQTKPAPKKTKAAQASAKVAPVKHKSKAIAKAASAA